MRSQNIAAELQQALDYLSVGLQELELAIIHSESAFDPRSEALNDAAGAIALGVQELRRQIAR